MSLDAIGIASRDIQKSIKFYELLGVSLKEVGGEHYEGTTPSGVRIMLDSYSLMKKNGLMNVMTKLISSIQNCREILLQ